ncbi:MAG: aspartate--ammonia ligase [Lactobacillus sp.]|jgi:aspartate--ammonia ligase|nr:aspartate--ammonia ligase [Lactobacillus sp.]
MSKMSVLDTLKAIKEIKDFFERDLSQKLNLTRVSAPLFVFKSSGLNDNLNGIERPVDFDVLNIPNERVEIVQSLAKWKRMALGKYAFEEGHGLYTDMNAIRRDDDIDPTHSIYVDQWDWEMVISKKDRTQNKLEETVKKIFSCLKDLEDMIVGKYSFLERYLPQDITIIDSQALEDLYPDLSADDRENEFCKKHGAVFVEKIGNALKGGKPHGTRAPDYDDWQLNGDILLWFPPLNKAMEISSMGIRVDEDIIIKQLEASNNMDRSKLPYHQDIINARLPYTIGGGIGQSRLCMYFLNKLHIGEVQSSVWPQSTIDECQKRNIKLL